MVSWETNDKNPSFKTFSLQPREQSHAFHRDKRPEPKNVISYKDVSLTEDSGIGEKCYGRLPVLCVFSCPLLAYEACPPFTLTVCTAVKHFLFHFFSQCPPSCKKLKALECKQIENRSEMLAVVRQTRLSITPPSSKYASPLDITWEKKCIIIIIWICILVHSLPNAFTCISSVQVYYSESKNSRFSLYVVSFTGASIQLINILRALCVLGLMERTGTEVLLGGAESCGENRKHTIKIHTNPLTKVHHVL